MQQHLPSHPGHGPAGLSPGMINPHSAMAAAGLPNPSGLLALTSSLGAGHAGGIPGMPNLPNPAGLNLPGIPGLSSTPGTPGSVGNFKNHRTEEGEKS